MSGYYRIPCHVNLNWSRTTYSHFCIQHLAQKALKRANYPEIPQKQRKNPPLETSKTENMLKMTHVRSKKQKRQKKIKGLLVLGDTTPRTKSNLLETFVLTDIKKLFLK